jgi:hypothetical protein
MKSVGSSNSQKIQSVDEEDSSGLISCDLSTSSDDDWDTEDTLDYDAEDVLQFAAFWSEEKRNEVGAFGACPRLTRCTLLANQNTLYVQASSQTRMDRRRAQRAGVRKRLRGRLCALFASSVRSSQWTQ